MATGGATRAVLVLALVTIFWSLPASTDTPQRLKRAATTARTHRATTIHAQSTTRAQVSSTTALHLQAPSSTIANNYGNDPSSTTVKTLNHYPGSDTRPGHVIQGSSQQEWTAKTFPNPQLQPELCSRGTQRSWVCDPNAVLTRKQADNIDNILSKQSASGRCQCGKMCAKSPSHKGIQGAVAITNKMYFMDSPSSVELQRAAGRFAEHLRNESWKFEMCNDSYVIFVSVKDRQVYTAVGEKAHKVITDNCIKKVMKEAQPNLSKRDYGKAVELIVKKYSDVLRFQHSCNRSASPATIGTIIGAIVAVIVLVCCCGLCCYCFKKQRSDSGPD